MIARTSRYSDFSLATGGDLIARKQFGVASSASFGLFNDQDAVTNIFKHECMSERLIRLDIAKIESGSSHDFELRSCLATLNPDHSEEKDEQTPQNI